MSNIISNDQLLNIKWKSYFNWTFAYPAVILLMFFTLVGALIYSRVNKLTGYNSMIAGFGGIMFIVILLIILSIPYIVWFFLASDKLFQLLGMDRTLYNILNICGFLLMGALPLLIITSIFLWFKVNSHWENRGIDHNWRGLLK